MNELVLKKKIKKLWKEKQATGTSQERRWEIDDELDYLLSQVGYDVYTSVEMDLSLELDMENGVLFYE